MMLALLFTACIANGPLPDSYCTPGAIDPNVTQANIASTICRPGYATSVRPPRFYTLHLKRQQMRVAGLPGKTSDYEEDHLIPLELGGAPRDPKNLWPEPWAGPLGARAKDRVEDFLHREVCSGRMSLVLAQWAIAQDWVSVYNRLPARKRGR